MDDETSSKSPSSGRFMALTNPVRGFAERAAGRVWPGRHGKPPAAEVASAHAPHTREDTPVQSFVTSEVISAFHLQQLHLPSSVERVTRGAVTSGKVAIVASVFALISLLGVSLWSSASGNRVVPTPQSSGDVATTTNEVQLRQAPSAASAVEVAEVVTPVSGAPVSTALAASAPPSERASLQSHAIHRVKPSGSIAVRPALEAAGERSENRDVTQSQGSLLNDSPGSESTPAVAIPAASVPASAALPERALPQSAAVPSAPAVVAPVGSARSAQPLLEVPRVRRQP